MLELPDKLQCCVVQATTYTGYGVNKQTLDIRNGTLKVQHMQQSSFVLLLQPRWSTHHLI